MWLRGVFVLCTFFLSSLEHHCDGSSDCGGCWLFCCPVLNTTAPVVQTAGECWCICEPLYRGPSRGPCIGTIDPTLLGFGGIQAIILSYSLFSLLWRVVYSCTNYSRTIHLYDQVPSSVGKIHMPDHFEWLILYWRSAVGMLLFPCLKMEKKKRKNWTSLIHLGVLDSVHFMM